MLLRSIIIATFAIFAVSVDADERLNSAAEPSVDPIGEFLLLGGIQSARLSISEVEHSKVHRAAVATEQSSSSSFNGPGNGPGGNGKQPRQTLTTLTEVTAAIAPDAATPSTTLWVTATASPGPPPPPNPPSSTTTSSTSATSTTPVVKTCWEPNLCNDMVKQFTSCGVVGAITDPNNVKAESSTYQSCLCISSYRSIRPDLSEASISNCYKCLKSSGFDLTVKPDNPPYFLVGKISDFCNTDYPNMNMVDMLLVFLDFTTWAQLPDTSDLVPDNVKSLRAIRGSLTSSSGMNVPTHIPDSPKGIPSDPNTPWWKSTLSSDGPIPTEYLAQLPSDWPYTEYGIARRAGKTTSWPLTNPNTTTQTVAWVYHEVLWNPRPLYTPAAEKAKRKAGAAPGLYDPALEGWSHDFLYETITPIGSLAASTSVAAKGVSPITSQSSAQPGDDAFVQAALGRSLSTTVSVTATGSLSGSLTPMPTPTSTPSPDDASAWSSRLDEWKSMKSKVDALP